MSDTVSKAYFQQRQRNRLYEIVVRAVERAAARGIRKRDIALKIGTSPSQISHFLSGPANWTIDSVSDVLFAIDAELDLNVVRFSDRQRSGNRYHILNDVRSRNSETPIKVTGTTGAATPLLISKTTTIGSPVMTQIRAVSNEAQD